MTDEKRIEIIREIAAQFGWEESEHKEEQYMLRFKNSSDALIDVWYSKMTVGTIISHPTKGRNQLFRRNVWSSNELKKLFENPRVHTDKGYYGGGQRITKKLCPHCGGEI